MSEQANFSYHSDLSFEAEMTGAEASGTLANAIEASGRELSTDERSFLDAVLAPGVAHFYDLARQAGELAGQGDILGAISLMGGEAHARELVGDEEVDGLLAELQDQAGRLATERPD